jgi:hypothetical protein
MAVAMGTSIGRVVDAVETSYRWWILAAATSTLDSTVAAGSATMDITAAMGSSSRRAVDATGNTADAVGTSSSRRVMPGMICIFSNYRLRTKFFVNIMQL